MKLVLSDDYRQLALIDGEGVRWASRRFPHWVAPILRLRVKTFDLGYALALYVKSDGWEATRIVAVARLPLPLSISSWRYLARRALKRTK